MTGFCNLRIIFYTNKIIPLSGSSEKLTIAFDLSLTVVASVTKAVLIPTIPLDSPAITLDKMNTGKEYDTDHRR